MPQCGFVSLQSQTHVFSVLKTLLNLVHRYFKGYELNQHLVYVSFHVTIFSIYVFLWRSHKKNKYIDGLKWRDLVGGRWWLVNFKVSGVTKGFACNTPQDSRHHVNVTRARGQPIPPQSYSISK